MGKPSKISMRTTLSDDGITDIEQMVDDCISTPIGNSDMTEEDDITENVESAEANDNRYALADADGHEDSGKVEFKDFDDKGLEEKLNSLYNEFLEDATITIANIKDMAFREAAIKGRWCSRLMAEKVRGKRLKQTLDRIVKELGNMVNSKKAGNSYLAARMQKDEMINENAEVIRLRREISDSKEIEDFLKKLYECISGLGYTIKNSLDVLKLERGI